MTPGHLRKLQMRLGAGCQPPCQVQPLPHGLCTQTRAVIEESSSPSSPQGRAEAPTPCKERWNCIPESLSLLPRQLPSGPQPQMEASEAIFSRVCH